MKFLKRKRKKTVTLREGDPDYKPDTKAVDPAS